MYDVLIIGGGPAGLSAAVYACRAGMKTAVFFRDGGALAKASLIENYFAQDALSGAELLARGREQASALGAELISAEVLGASLENGFALDTSAGRYEGRSLIIAVGNERKRPSVADAVKYEGRGVSYCAVCDAFFFRGKAVAVLGGGAYARHEASYLANVAGSVALLTNGEKSEEPLAKTDKIAGLYGENALEGVIFEGGERLAVSGLFVAEGFAGASEFANKLGVFTENGTVNTGAGMETNLPGCFAAGDCTGGLAQVVSAAAQGAQAALSAVKYLRK